MSVLVEVGGFTGGMLRIALPLIICHSLVQLAGLSESGHTIPSGIGEVRVGADDNEFSMPPNAGEENSPDGHRLVSGDSLVCVQK